MKRAIAILLTLCMLLSMLPSLPARAAGDRLAPPSDVVFSTKSGELEIGFANEPLTAEQKAWLADVGDVEINGEHYKEANQNYSFVREEDRLIISNHNFVLPENTVRILAGQYTAYSQTYPHPTIQKMTDGLSIDGVTLAQAGDDLKTSDCVSIRLTHDYNTTGNAGIYTLIKHGLKSMTIDGKTFNAEDSQDGRQSFFLKNTVLSMYDQTPDGKIAVAHFKGRNDHQVIMTFADGSELKYEDPGYVAPEGKEEPAPAQALDQNTGGMAAGWGFVKFEQAANNWNGAKMESDLPQNQWYDHYIKNIRCVFIDDQHIADRQEIPGDVTLQNDVLAFATYGRVFNGEPHKMVIVFKDGNTITHIDAGYQPPQKPKDLAQYLKDKPTIKDEPSNPSTGEVSQKYIFDVAKFEKGWGDPEITVSFKGFGNEAKAKEVIRDMQTFTVNGKSYRNPDLWTASYKGLICNAQAVITPLYGKDKLDLTFFWKDGTQSTISQAITPVEDPKGPKKPEKPKAPELSTEDQSLEDDDGEVQVTAPAGALPKDVSLSVVAKTAKEVLDGSSAYAKAVADKALVTAFDISFSSGNKEVQPKKPVSVSLPLGTHDPKTLVVYHINKEGQAEKVDPIKVTNNRVNFSADHFSTYALASGKKETAKPDQPKGKLAETYPIERVALEKASWGDSKYMRIYLKNYKKPNDKESREAIEKAFKEATLTLNGQDFTGLTATTGFEAIEINEFDEIGPQLKKAWEAAGDRAKIKVTFADGSHWQNYEEVAKTTADKLAITGIQEKMDWQQKVDSIVLQSEVAKKLSNEEKNALGQELSKASWLVNGETFQDQAVGYTNGMVEGYEVYSVNTAFYEAYAKQSPASIKVTFADGSSWDNGVGAGDPDAKNEYDLTDRLPDGDYTLSFDVTKPDGSASMLAGFLDQKAKLTVEKGKKTVTFLMTSNAQLLIDFAISQEGSFVAAQDAVYGKAEEGRKTYTVPVDGLDQVYDLAILNKMMGGQDSDKGHFDKYTKAKLAFKTPVLKGWKGFDLADKPAIDQAKNDENLRLKLIDQRVDTNGDGKISKEELQKAKGKLDLSNEKIGPTPDVSILKDLGPGVTELYLDANGIESLPDGFFDKMTGLGHLSLSGNKLTSLPKDAFAKNTKLHTLWMEGNGLIALDPTLFANNPGLLELAISRNRITSLPKGLLANNSKLQKLYASGNGLTDIDEETFGQMKRLEELQLGDNRLAQLPHSISRLARLAELNLENNRLTGLPQGMDKLRNLYKVNLSNNAIKALDESFWLRMARNSSGLQNKYPNLDVSGNLLTAIPFDKMLDQGAKFNKFDVSRNYLPATLSPEEAAKLQRLGITIGDGMENFYYPQMTALAPTLTAEAGTLTLQQDLDMLQMALWKFKDVRDWGSFLDPASYLAFVKNKLYKKHHITTINDHLGIAQILNKMGMDWQIRTIIEKQDGDSYREISNALLSNEGHNGQVSDVDPVDDRTFTFADPDMKAGDHYRLTRILTSKTGTAAYTESLRYSVEATAAGEEPAPQPEAASAWTVPIQVLKEKGKMPSMAANVFSKAVEVVKTADGYATTITFKPLSMGGLTGYMQDLDLYETVDDQTLGKVRALPLTNIKKDAKGLTAVTFMSQEKPQDLYYGTVYFTIGEPNGKNTTDANVRLVLNWDQAQATKWSPVDQEKTVAKAALEKAIAQAEAKLADGKTYTDASKQAVEKALTKAKAALNKDTAAMKAATGDLDQAVAQLKEKPTGQQVPIQVFKADEDVPSMASGAVEPEAQVTQVEDGWQVDITFKPMSVGPLKGHLEEAFVYDNLADMTSKKAKELRKPVTVVDSYTDAGKSYPKTIRVMTKDKPTTIGLAVVVDMMKAMGGDGEANMRVVLNWPGDEPAVDQEKVAAKAALEKAIAQAEAKLADGKTYTDASKQAVEKALATAKATLDKDTAALKAASSALNKAVSSLKEKPVIDQDKVKAKADLEKAIAQAEAKLADGKNYTDASKQALKEALAAAKATLNKDTAAMKAAASALNKAVSSLKEKPVIDQDKVKAKADLEKAIAQAEAKLADGKNYTDASKQALKEALAAAKATLDQDTAAMDAARQSLNRAVKGLVVASKPAPEERSLKVKAFIRHASKDQASMANRAFYPEVDVVEKGDEATYTLYFKTMTLQGLEGHITSVSVDGETAEAVAGRDSTYAYGFRFTRPSQKEKELKLTFNVDMMAGVSQDAILVLDWSGKTKPPVAGPNQVDPAADQDKEALKDKDLKALVAEAEGLIKDPKYADKDLKALKAAVEEAKAAQSEKEEDKAKQALIQAISDLKTAGQKKADQPPTNQPTQPAAKAFSLTQPKGGYISGYPNGTFRPDQLVNRAEAAAMLAQFVLTQQKANQLPKDALADSWYTDSLRTLIGAGLLSGYEDGTARPDKTMTRAEMIALIGRMKGLAPQAAQYTDLTAGHWAYQAIGGAQKAGIVAGYPDGSFKPDQGVSRAEMVAMVNRAFGYTGTTTGRAFTDLTPGHWAYGEIQKAARA
ncbi:S-layer homology domain-containing protein [Peptococcus simiae]|uniref:S-layer homology domain-containing protein n=1 Tax=Peptococcus simiae TaxID=1643805 RepID=A0ABW9GVP8_9FIRM